MAAAPTPLAVMAIRGHAFVATAATVRAWLANQAAIMSHAALEAAAIAGKRLTVANGNVVTAAVDFADAMTNSLTGGVRGIFGHAWPAQALTAIPVGTTRFTAPAMLTVLRAKRISSFRNEPSVEACEIAGNISGGAGVRFPEISEAIEVDGAGSAFSDDPSGADNLRPIANLAVTTATADSSMVRDVLVAPRECCSLMRHYNSANLPEWYDLWEIADGRAANRAEIAALPATAMMEGIAIVVPGFAIDLTVTAPGP